MANRPQNVQPDPEPATPWSEIRTMAPPGTCILLGPAKWAAIKLAASVEDLAALLELEERGRIVVSPHLPSPQDAYLFTPPPITVATNPAFWNEGRDAPAWRAPELAQRRGRMSHGQGE